MLAFEGGLAFTVLPSQTSSFLGLSYNGLSPWPETVLDKPFA
jgi:hypothetical protein